MTHWWYSHSSHTGRYLRRRLNKVLYRKKEYMRGRDSKGFLIFLSFEWLGNRSRDLYSNNPLIPLIKLSTYTTEYTLVESIRPLCRGL